MALRLHEVVIDCADHEVVVPFWLAAMGDHARHDVNEQYVGIAPRERDIGRPTILFQKVPEPKTVKNRVHLDLRGELPARGGRAAAGAGCLASIDQRDIGSPGSGLQAVVRRGQRQVASQGEIEVGRVVRRQIVTDR